MKFTPKTGYAWNDGTSSQKSCKWTIAKASYTMSVSTTRVHLSSSVNTGEITVTKLGDGKIYANSSNSSIATASVSGSKVIFTAIADGEVDFTIGVQPGTNYTAPNTINVNVSVALGIVARLQPLTSVSYSFILAGITPEKWSEYAKAISNNQDITNRTRSVYIDDDTEHYRIKVGDTKTITVRVAVPNDSVGTSSVSSAQYTFAILGFNHDQLYESGAYGVETKSGMAGITFGMVDCVKTPYLFSYPSGTEAYSWDSTMALRGIKFRF